jgi:hypothetical protein
MNFFQKWIIDKFLKGQISKILSKLSGPLDGKKSPITGGLLVILLIASQAMPNQAVKDLIQAVIDQIAAVGTTSLEDARNVTLAAFLAAVAHRLTKSDGQEK